jgi:hypothetical protein
MRFWNLSIVRDKSFWPSYYMTGVVQWWRLTLSKGPNRVGVYLPSSQDGNMPSFRKAVSYFTPGRRTRSINPVIMTFQKVQIPISISLQWTCQYEGLPQSKFPTRPTGSKPYITRSDCVYVIEQWRSMAPALTALPAFSQYQCYSCWRWRLLFQLPPTVKCGQW